MKRRVLFLLVAPILGAVFGYLFSSAMNYRWFSSNWQLIEKPPMNSVLLVALSADSVWVKGDNGVTYYNKNSSTCTKGCWQLSSGVPSLPIVEPYESMVTQTGCAPIPPLSNVVDSISECRREMWVDRNYSYSLRKDGNIYLWQADLYKEWSSMVMLSGIFNGAIIFFIPALLIFLFFELLDWLSKRVRN